MDSLAITIIGGVVVVIVGLSIEYGIIQRRRRNVSENLQSNIASSPNPQVADNVSSPDKPSKTDADLPWPKAINKAVDEFRILHKGKIVHVTSTNTKDRFAYLSVNVWRSGSKYDENYNIVVDKTGEITSIKEFHYP